MNILHLSDLHFGLHSRFADEDPWQATWRVKWRPTGLARHLARRSTADDRALLIDLARHPEQREPPLRWGLQFIVRGDLIFDGGEIVTLDELADEVGVPRLPYLEDLPDELELDEAE